MTIQEAYALAAERQENLEYRSKINRIKNTVLGAILGSAAGGITGLANTDKSKVDQILGRPLPKTKAIGGAALGAALGGLAGYGTTRLKEKLRKHASVTPIEKSAQLSELGVLIGRGGAQFGRGVNWLLTNSGKLAGRAGRASINKLNRFLELLGGGKKEKLRDYKLVKDYIKDQLESAKASGRNTKDLEELLANAKDSFLRGKGGPFEVPTARGALSISPTQEISDELGNVITARTLAGGGALGGGYYLIKKYKDKNKPWYKKI